LGGPAPRPPFPAQDPRRHRRRREPRADPRRLSPRLRKRRGRTRRHAAPSAQGAGADFYHALPFVSRLQPNVRPDPRLPASGQGPPRSPGKTLRHFRGPGRIATWSTFRRACPDEYSTRLVSHGSLRPHRAPSGGNTRAPASDATVRAGSGRAQDRGFLGNRSRYLLQRNRLQRRVGRAAVPIGKQGFGAGADPISRAIPGQTRILRRLRRASPRPSAIGRGASLQAAPRHRSPGTR